MLKSDAAQEASVSIYIRVLREKLPLPFTQTQNCMELESWKQKELRREINATPQMELQTLQEQIHSEKSSGMVLLLSSLFPHNARIRSKTLQKLIL